MLHAAHVDDRPDRSSIRSPRASLPEAHGRRVRVVVDAERDDLVVRKTGSSPRAITAIEREALVLSQVRHPDVAELITTERGDGTVTIVTRFAGRSTLANFRSPDLDVAVRLVSSLFRVLDELHAMGWVHGRVTPDHCVVDPAGRITLCAFGAAHRADGGDARFADDVADAVAVAGMVLDRVPVATRRDRRALAAVRKVLGAIRPDAPAALHAATVALATRRGAAGANDDGDTTRPTSGRPVTARSHNRASTPSTPRPTGVAVRSSPGRLAVAAGAAVTLAGLVGAVALIRHLGGPLGASFDDGVGVADLPHAVVVAITVIRFAAIAACLYGIALSAATLAAVATRRPDLARLAARLAPARFRHSLVVLIGVGMLVSASGPRSGTMAAPAGASGSVPPTWAGTAAATTTSTPPTAATPPTTAATPPTAAPAAATSHAATTPSTPDAAVAPTAPGALPLLWVIEPGDHLWSIAETTLTDRLGRAPSDAEIAPYWSAIIELNRDSFVDRDNPDLVHVGQVIELPPG